MESKLRQLCVQDDDDKPSKMDKTRHHQPQHPLLIAEVVAEILKFHDLQNLKETRRVCHLWREEGTFHVLKKSYVKFPRHLIMPKRHSTSTRGVIMSNAEPALGQALSSLMSLGNHPINLHLDTYILEEIFDEFAPIISTRVELLKWTREKNRFGPHINLEYFLGKLPNIKILDTVDLDLDPLEGNQQPGRHAFTNYDNGTDRPSRDLEPLLQKLASLDKIKLSCDVSKNLEQKQQQFMPHHRRLDNITQLVIKSSSLPSSHSIVSLLVSHDVQWPVEKLDLHLTEIPLTLTRQLIDLFSRTLRQLSVNIPNLTGDTVQLLPGNRLYEDDWYLPQECLKKNLKFLSIMAFDPMSLARTFWVVLGLSKLKKVEFRGSTDLDRDTSKILESWSQDQDYGKKMENRQVTTMTIEKWTPFCGSVLSPNFFPCLKTLEVTLGGSTPPNLETIFQHLDQLEGLKISMPTYGHQVVDHIFIGGYPRVKRLGKLKWLTCTQMGVARNVFTDSLIYGGLIYLKNLQAVHIERGQFSDQALSDLRDVLGPTASIRLLSAKICRWV